MRLADLSPERRAWLAAARWDRIIEKHEGPEDWRWELAQSDTPSSPERVDFLTLGGYDVLLPIPVEQHPKVSLLWLIRSADQQILTLYVKNMQWAEWYPGGDYWSTVGFLAVCERAPEGDWYVAILYHEAFLAPDLTPLRLPSWPAPAAADDE
jgi:hypothetical protein